MTDVSMHFYFHGLVILAVGLLGGVPFATAIRTGNGREVAWRVVHAGASSGGALVIAMGSMIGHLGMSGRWNAIALVTQLVVSIGVALWLGNQYDPFTGFVILATILVDIFAPMYILLNIACLMYFLRFRRDEFNVLRHAILPILGALAFIPAFFAGAGIPAFSFITSLPRPLWYAGPIAAIWMVIGIAYLLWLNARDPRRILETKRVFDED